MTNTESKIPEPSQILTVKPADLKQIISEKVEAPTQGIHLSTSDYQEKINNLKTEAKLLASKLFELTNNVREKNLNVYLKTINDVVLARTSKENQTILTNTKIFFTEMYGDYIRKLGHSPDLLEEIVHRTGPDSREIVSKTLSGFNAPLLALRIRAKSADFSPDADTITARIMYDLTHQQVRELREEYNSLAARELAILLYSALKRKNLRGEDFPDLFTLNYLLINRNKKELAQIEFQYNELFHFTHERDKDLCLREQIKTSLNELFAQKILKLLEGFDPALVAEKIFDCISNYQLSIEGLDGLKHLKLHSDFATTLRRNRQELETHTKEAIALTSIKQIVSGLTEKQFQEVLILLKDKYDLILTPIYYQEIGKLNPRNIALNLFKACLNTDARIHKKRDEQYLSDEEINAVKKEFRLSKESELSDIIHYRAEEKIALICLDKTLQALVPLLYLTPSEMQLVKESFQIYFGQSLDKFVGETISSICRGPAPRYVQDLVELLMSGRARQSVKIDLFELFANRAKRERSKQHTSLVETVTKRLPELITLINKSVELGQTDQLLGYLKTFSTEELQILEELSSRSSTNPKPFLKGLEEMLPAELTTEIAILMKGFDCDVICQDLFANPQHSANYLFLNAEDSYVIIKMFSNKYDISLVEHINKHLEGLDQELALIFALTATAIELRECLLLSESDPIHEELIIKILTKFKDRIYLLEACYNKHFADFSICFERNSGLLLQTLRQFASEQKVSRILFSRAINILEQIPADVTEKLYALVTSSDITPHCLKDLQQLLRQNIANASIVNKSYNALDAEHTLRDRIHLLKISLDNINQTLLLLDGFDPLLVAQQVVLLVSKLQGVELGQALSNLLAKPSKVRPNTLIPSDHNWTQEMYHQIRKSYLELSGKELVADLIGKSVPLNNMGVNHIAHLLYGEPALSALKIFKILKNELELPTNKANQIISLLNQHEKHLIERLVSFYNSYFITMQRSTGFQIDLEEQLGFCVEYQQILKQL